MRATRSDKANHDARCRRSSAQNTTPTKHITIPRIHTYHVPSKRWLSMVPAVLRTHANTSGPFNPGERGPKPPASSPTRRRYDGRLRGCSSAAEHQLPKLRTRVRFPSPAPRPNLITAPIRNPPRSVRNALWCHKHTFLANHVAHELPVDSLKLPHLLHSVELTIADSKGHHSPSWHAIDESSNRRLQLLRLISTLDTANEPSPIQMRRSWSGQRMREISIQFSGEYQRRSWFESAFGPADGLRSLELTTHFEAPAPPIDIRDRDARKLRDGHSARSTTAVCVAAARRPGMAGSRLANQVPTATSTIDIHGTVGSGTT